MVVGDEAKSAESQAACHTLAHELTEQRFPAPRMLSFKVLPCTFELTLQHSLARIHNILQQAAPALGFPEIYSVMLKSNLLC